MKIKKIDYHKEQETEEVRNGIYVYDGKGEEFRITLDQFGQLEIYSNHSNILVKPNVANHITIKTE